MEIVNCLFLIIIQPVLPGDEDQTAFTAIDLVELERAFRNSLCLRSTLTLRKAPLEADLRRLLLYHQILRA